MANKLKLPILMINFKTYEEATGKKALKLARICEEVSKKHKVSIAVAPQDVDIYRISSRVDIPIFAQSIEPIEPDAHTGHELALAAKEAGAVGSLINHSENRLSLEGIKKCVQISRRFGLISVCCVHDEKMIKKVVMFKPDFIAFEDPELIGTGKAVSKVKPESVKKFVKILSGTGIIPLCGAGISSGRDIKTALELGTKGVIVASAVVKSKKHRIVLEDMGRTLKEQRNHFFNSTVLVG